MNKVLNKYLNSEFIYQSMNFKAVFDIDLKTYKAIELIELLFIENIMFHILVALK